MERSSLVKGSIMFARGDPRWQEFWRARMENQKMGVYLIVPLLEAVSCMLYAAERLAHPVKRREKKLLREMAADLTHQSELLRKKGIGWIPQRAFPDGPRVIVSGNPRRTHIEPEDTVPPSPPDALMLIETISFLLSRFDTPLLSMEKVFHEERWLASWLFGHRETLLGISSKEAVQTPGVIDAFDSYTLLLECEMLAYIQAAAEDALSRKTGNIKKKESDRSDAEIAELAREIDMPFEDVKAACSREYSSWWKVSQGFGEQAEVVRIQLVGELPTIHKGSVRSSWKTSGVYLNNAPYPLDSDALREGEQVVSLLIEMFLAHPGLGGAREMMRSLEKIAVAKKRLK